MVEESEGTAKGHKLEQLNPQAKDRIRRQGRGERDLEQLGAGGKGGALELKEGGVQCVAGLGQGEV